MIQLDLREPALAIACAHAERSPDDADAWFWLGYVHQLNRQDDAALDAYQRCAQRAPGHAMLHNNLAALHRSCATMAPPKRISDEALKDDPDNVSAWTNLSMWWIKSGVPAAAHLAAERALALNPQYVLAWQGFSNACKELQSWDAATEAIERAHALEPNNDAHRWSLAMLQLMRGDYANGWINHEARWPGSPELRGAQPTWAAPRWDAQAVAGKTVLVWSEQGTETWCSSCGSCLSLRAGFGSVAGRLPIVRLRRCGRWSRALWPATLCGSSRRSRRSRRTITRFRWAACRWCWACR
ncbi:tetratricopeptide repeat protein [Burkholderia vietnamiensis]|uniref:tetratricopeptide repeat protein n=1 Tax=Burkholderia vietnamiensis TaxID=60552 RepID=UPI00402AAFC7